MMKNEFEQLVDVLLESISENVFGTCNISSSTDVPNNAKHFIDENTSEHVLSIQAAGFKKEDISIDANNKGITIKGEIKDEKKKNTILRNKFHYILHKNNIDINSINANLEDGLLLIKFKIEGEKSTKIEIK